MHKIGSLKLKLALLISGVVIALLVLLYTQTIVHQVQKREAMIANLYAKSLQYIANDESASGEYNFIFNEIITQIDFPIIATDKDFQSVSFYKNLDIDTALPEKEKQKLLLSIVKEMNEINPPIKVTFRDSIVLNYVSYGQSALITQLKALPVFEIIVGGIFIFLGYFAFSYIKKHEQSNIWVGLSRETAHQLGTPLSSLMGWVELLKNTDPFSGDYKKILAETENDLEKLSKIATRFSKIGSLPKLETENLKEVISEAACYIQKRIPSLTDSEGKVKQKVTVEINAPEDLHVKLNIELFEWVIENLMKNALDAIDKEQGMIKFDIHDKDTEVLIDVSDNGKGIEKIYKKDIFRPGFSTKRRGWGLGLSLAKRIVDEYHKGKLTILESSPEKGTTFRIKLNK
ncbi:MAG: HAMP domain-containing histidine kinase [Ignavibacteria bacterium]|nr:HAMP domain-containing histidine kinase [Ignavibacteria bacterium]